MFTVCPKCTLTLAVTAADLRAGQGYVRCGRCANVFNALLGLSEEQGAPAAGTDRPRQPPAEELDTATATASRPLLADPMLLDLAAADQVTAPAAPAPPPTPSAPPALRLVESPPRPPPPALPDTPEDDWAVQEFHSSGTFETIVLEGDTFLQTEEMVPEEALDSELADVSRRIAAAQDSAARNMAARQSVASAAPEPAIAPGLAALRDAARAVHTAADPADATGALAQLRSVPAPRTGWLPVMGAMLLAVVLAAQAINHWRNDLATRNGWYGPLASISAWLGEPLHPNWDLSAYDVRQLGAGAEGPDNRALRVRLSLANVGNRTEGLPLLRLTLLDRFGKALSAGELRPDQYLPAGLRGQQFLLREQRIDTEVSVLDPSRQASSFELDVCVIAAGGGLHCAGDTPVGANPP